MFILPTTRPTKWVTRSLAPDPTPFGGDPVDAAHGLADEHGMERHRQRGGPVGPVPRVRSLRAGLPVVDRDRTVSPNPACRKLSLTAGAVSASSVVSHTDPHHTPSALRAMPAASCRPRATPPGGEHRDGPRRRRAPRERAPWWRRAGVPTGLGALGDDKIGGGGVPADVLDGPGQGPPTGMPAGVGSLNEPARSAGPNQAIGLARAERRHIDDRTDR